MTTFTTTYQQISIITSQLINTYTPTTPDKLTNFILHLLPLPLKNTEYCIVVLSSGMSFQITSLYYIETLLRKTSQTTLHRHTDTHITHAIFLIDLSYCLSDSLLLYLIPSPSYLSLLLRLLMDILLHCLGLVASVFP